MSLWSRRAEREAAERERELAEVRERTMREFERRIDKAARERHARIRNFVGRVIVTAGSDTFGAWGAEGPVPGRDEFVITDLRLVGYDSRMGSRPVVANDAMLRIGKSASFRLDAMPGLGEVFRGVNTRGWIKLRYPAQFARTDTDVFCLTHCRLGDYVALDVVANIAVEVTP
jgi:hypothetical protein